MENVLRLVLENMLKMVSGKLSRENCHLWGCGGNFPGDQGKIFLGGNFPSYSSSSS